MFLKLSIFLLPLSLAYTDYTPESYPDSLSSHTECDMPEPGYICDPSGILNADKTKNGTQRELIKLLNDAQRNTTCACGKSLVNLGACDQPNETGFIISVALTERMTLNDDEQDNNSKLRAAQIFADRLRERQGRGHCQDDLLIFVSQIDRVTWTSLGQITNLFLSNEMTVSVGTHADDKYFKYGRYEEGIKYMVNTYTRILAGEKVDITENHHWYSPLPLWAVIVIGVVIGLVLLALIGLSIFCCVKKCKKDDRGAYTMGTRM